MTMMYLPFAIYSAMLDAMFQGWGSRPDRKIIVQKAKVSALPARKRKKRKSN